MLAEIGTYECRKWAHSQFSRFDTSGALKNAYIIDAEKFGHILANHNLREACEKIESKFTKKPIVEKTFLESIANKHALKKEMLTKKYEATAKRKGEKIAIKELKKDDNFLSVKGDETKSCCMEYSDMQEMGELRAVEFSEFNDFNKDLQKVEIEIVNLARQLEKYGIEFPEILNASETEKSLTKKLIKAYAKTERHQWWRRKLNTQFSRQMEEFERANGGVRAKTQCAYISNTGLGRHRIEKKRNEEFIKSCVMVNAKTGESVDLYEIWKGSIANKEVRFAEMARRVRGISDYADIKGMEARFLTLTLPSKFHAYTKKGYKNSKYQGKTPKDGIDHLNNNAAKVRAKLNRDGIQYAGMKTTEANHDGTPHQHIMIWASENDIDEIERVYKKYSCEEDSHEILGSEEKRFTSVKINKEKGSAISYLIKYISKNISSEKLGIDDESGLEGAESAERVTAWAATWGIRQFSFFGVPPVGVYRAMRKRALPLNGCESIELRELHEVCRDGDYAKYIELMGGFCVKRGDERFIALEQENERLSQLLGDEIKVVIGVQMNLESGGFEYVDFINPCSTIALTNLSKWEIMPIIRDKIKKEE